MNKFQGKVSKYGAKKITVDGIKFDSIMESDFYLLLKKKKIKFSLQPKFELQAGFKKKDKRYLAVNYIGDFRVNDTIIDVKGMKTPVFNLKKKLFEYKYSELDLVCITKCPYKYKEHALIDGYTLGKWIGFVENEKLDKLRKLNKKK